MSHDLENVDRPRAQETLEQRSARRRERMVTNLAADYAEAEQWDLDFWQSQTPEERLSALIAIRRDVAAVEKAREGQD